MAQSVSFPHSMPDTRGNQQLEKINVNYDVKPAKMLFTSHENLLVHPLLLPVSSQREWTIEMHILFYTVQSLKICQFKLSFSCLYI